MTGQAGGPGLAPGPRRCCMVVAGIFYTRQGAQAPGIETERSAWRAWHGRQALASSPGSGPGYATPSTIRKSLSAWAWRIFIARWYSSLR
jgi:hypothetical protein